MSLMNRFSDIMKSNINALLDKCEDPAKMIDQTLRNAKEDLAEVRKETAEVMADAKHAAREYDKCQAAVNQYAQAAKNALRAGNEADARTLLAQKQTYESNLQSLQATKELTAANSQKMQQMHDKLTRDIQVLETKRSSIKAKIATTKAQEHINDVVTGGMKARASLNTFDRMEERANKMLDASMAEAELTKDAMKQDDLLGKYSGDSDGSTVDDALAAMKAELGL